MANNYQNLNAEKALIWRIVHRDNLPWILDNGVHCPNSRTQNPHYVSIGNAELIDRRAYRAVPISPGGTLSDYVPFYFTPFSPMMYSIKTGHGGIRKRDNEEIVILVSSLRRVQELGLPFVFTDRHAYTQLSRFFDNLANLADIDWQLIQRRDFKRDPDDLEKVERYQAEALVHRLLPIAALLGVVCYNNDTGKTIQRAVENRGLQLDVRAIPGWYF